MVEAIKSRLEELGRLEPGWDSHNSWPPSESVMSNARAALGVMESVGLTSDGVVPIPEGGVAFRFLGDRKYADIDFYNGGDEVWAMIDDKNSVGYTIWQIVEGGCSLLEAIQRIKDFMAAEGT